MNKITDLGNGLIAIEVPIYEANFYSEPAHVNNVIDSRYQWRLYFGNDFLIFPHDFEILGTVTAEAIDFDVEAYVEKEKHYTWGGFGYATTEDVYIDYCLIDVAICRTKDESFYSLLRSKGLTFENDIPKPNKLWQDEIMEEGLHHRYKLDIQKWQSAEEKVVKKGILINKL